MRLPGLWQRGRRRACGRPLVPRPWRRLAGFPVLRGTRAVAGPEGRPSLAGRGRHRRGPAATSSARLAEHHSIRLCRIRRNRSHSRPIAAPRLRVLPGRPVHEDRSPGTEIVIPPGRPPQSGIGRTRPRRLAAGAKMLAVRPDPELRRRRGAPARLPDRVVLPEAEPWPAGAAGPDIPAQGRDLRGPGGRVRISTATAWRYVMRPWLLSARAPKLRAAPRAAKRSKLAFVVIDGTLIPSTASWRTGR
jgi:hypothetical protein